MNSNTCQKVKNPAVQQSKLSTAAWSKVFPTKLETEVHSRTFVKKLLSVSLSNITYVRNMFPEEAYVKKTLGKVPLKILREKSNCEKACILAKWLIGAFDAIERKYLKQVNFIVYLDPEEPDKILEMYSFKFSYDDNVVHCKMVERIGGKEALSQEYIQQTTEELLRTVLLMTQGLEPLPESAHLSMRLTYHEEVTPPDYEPPSFCPTIHPEPTLPKGVQKVSPGEVATKHHAIKLQMKAKPKDITKTSNETQAVLMDDYFYSQSQTQSQTRSNRNLLEDHPEDNYSKTSHADVPSPSVPMKNIAGERDSFMKDNDIDVDMESQGTPKADDLNTDPEEMKQKPTIIKATAIIDCTCGNKMPDPLMLLCGHCSKSQHAACYRILDSSQIPVEHCCVKCYQEGKGERCTDQKLPKMSMKESASVTCLYRRILALIVKHDSIVKEDLVKMLGEEEFSDEIIKKLQVDGLLNDQLMVNKDTLFNKALPKYMGIKNYDPVGIIEEDIRSIVSGTAGLEVGGSRVQGAKRGFGQVMPEDDPQNKGNKQRKVSKCVDDIPV